MKRLLVSLPLLMIIAGCSTSHIKIAGKTGEPDIYTMFGKISSRDFYVPVTLIDSLVPKWEWEINGSFPQSSITYFREYLFINDLSGRVYCLNSSTGKITGQLKHKGTIYTTPVISRYNVIYIESINDDDISYLRVYNFIEGKAIAETEIKGRVITEIIKQGSEIFFVTEKGLLYKFSSIGDQYWVKDIGGEVHSSPASDGSIIYVANSHGELLKIDMMNGSILDTIKTEADITSGLTIIGSSIIMGDKKGFLYSFDIDNGKLNWKYDTGSKITAVPVSAKNKIYTVNLAGDIAAVDNDSGKEKWRIKTGGLLNSTPLVTDNFLIVPDLSKRILFIDPEDGTEKKTIELPDRAKLSPVIIGNLLIIGFDRGVIRAYEIF